MADQIIDLGSITWDLSSIDKQILENRKQLQGYSEALKYNKDALKQQSKEIQNAAKTIVFLEEMQRELNDSLQAGTISQDDYVAATIEVNKELQETRTRTAEVVETQSILIQSNIEMERTVRDLQNETRTLNTLRQAGREEAYQEVGAYKSLNDELNALKRESKDLGAEMVRMQRNGEENTDAYKSLEERYRSVTAQAEELNTQFVNLDAAVGDNQRNVGNYTESIKNAFAGITDGFNKMLSGDVRGGFDDIKNGLKGVKEGASDLFKTLAANPWLAVLTVVVGGIIAFTKEMIEHNKYITEANGKVEDLAHTTGELTNELRRAGEAINQTFENKSFEDAITEMDSLMDDFKISSAEAWDTYVTGLARGGAANDDFGDSIKEYGALFAQNGFSAQQFINILNAGIDLGIYSDKLPDAIKEAGLSLNEQTKATRDALVNAFGASFSDTLLKNIQQGRLTIAQALDEIADKSEKTNLNQQQQAQLTADLFKGAGEDAGGAIVVFDALNKAQNQSSDNLTELQKKTIELAEINLELEKSKDAAFSNDSVRTFRKDFDLTWKQIQIGWYKALAGGSEFFKFSNYQIDLFSRVFREAILMIPKAFKELSKSILADLGFIAGTGAKVGEVIGKALTLDIEGTKNSYKELKNQILDFSSSTFKSIEKTGNFFKESASRNAKALTDINKAKAEAQRLDDEAEAKRQAGNGKITGATGDEAAKAAAEAKKKADAEAKKAETKRIADLKKSAADAAKELEDIAKREIEIQKERAQQSTDIAKGELAEYIRINAEKYKDDKSLAAKKLEDQLAYFDEVAKKQKAINEAEREAAAIALDIQIRALENKRVLNSTELAELQNLKNQEAIINQQAVEKDADTEKQVAEKKKEINKKYTEDVLEQEKLSKSIAFQQELLDLEAKGENQLAVRKLQLEKDTTQQVDEFLKKNELLRELDQEEYDLEAEIKLAREELEAELQVEKDETEKSRIQNKLGELSLIESQYANQSKEINKAVDDAKIQGRERVLSALSSIFGRESAIGKAIAVAEILNNTYTQAAKAFQQGSVFASNPLTAALAPNAFIQGGIIIASGAANIAKLVTAKGFSSGGYTGSGSIDEVAGLVHKGEVVFSQADVQALGGAAVVDAMRPTAGGYFGSSVGVSNLPNVQSAMMGGNIVVMLDENSVSLIADATYAGSQKGIGDMADNTDIRLGANFG